MSFCLYNYLNISWTDQNDKQLFFNSLNYILTQPTLYTHLALTENRLKFFVPSNPTNNYENIYIWWHEIIKINLVSQALFEKTHFSVILYYKIDHICPLKINFHTFPAIWPNVWVWNSLLLSCYHLLNQKVRVKLKWAG